MANSYAMRMDEPESWTIFDIFTGQPVELKHRVMVGMSIRDAEAMAVRLNNQDVKRRTKADRKA